MAHDEREKYLIRYAGDFAPFVVESAEGSWVTTTEGQRILDFTSGQISSTLGHNHPRIVAAVERSLREVIHLNSWMVSEDVLELARRLAGLLPEPLARSILLNTGSETNEIAFRLAKAYTGKFEMVGVTRSFHGLLAGTNSLTYSMGHKGNGPLMPGSFAIPAPYEYRCPIRHCVNACDKLCLDVGFETVDQSSVGSLAAMVVEPVLSTGGIIPLPDGYLAAAKQKCEERDMLLIVDEAQTGFGRVGSMFAFEQDGVVPDILTVSKTLGGGVPLGATVTSAEIEERCADQGFLHITTHVSDPMPAAAGLAVLDVIAEEELVARAAATGEYLFARLRELQERHEEIGDVRGRGLLVGLELVTDRETKEPASALGAAVTSECLRLGLSMNIVKGDGSQTNCLRMAPPLAVTHEEVDTAVDILDRALTNCKKAAAGRPADQTYD
ncbi:aspartate aminotransferase family protein [Streptomyces armeniacus]|uniref:Aspartate aminotransferase family protein n=1 Tax=Streptomyces armeniacus TaxID=83291 RepID=A0A345XMF6_9ACTN|nr:aspartate aminotransferase family protein [Streptomyces armeniacus]AXK32822.1 aspartate aminotransferase family protein [Streptomyces armeniacus]